MKKYSKLIAFISSVFMLIGVYCNVFANEKSNEEVSVVYNISDLESVTYDENGNIVYGIVPLSEWSINGSRIEPEQTKYYFPSVESKGFMINTDDKVDIYANFSRNATVQIGFEGGSSAVVSGRSIKVSLRVYSTGFHRLFIKNLGGETITVNGTIEY